MAFLVAEPGPRCVKIHQLVNKHQLRLERHSRGMSAEVTIINRLQVFWIKTLVLHFHRLRQFHQAESKNKRQTNEAIIPICNGKVILILRSCHQLQQ